SLNVWEKTELAIAHQRQHEPDQPAPVRRPSRLSAKQKEARAARELKKAEEAEAAQALTEIEEHFSGPRTDEPPSILDVTVAKPRNVTGSASWDATRARNAWHVSADLTDQYSPVLFAHVDKGFREREAALRDINDELREQGQVPSQPLIFVMDEIPIFLRRGKGAASRVAWTIHAVGEVIIRQPQGPSGPLLRENRLRLARALPGPASASSWLLVQDEIGVVPDIVIADQGQALATSLSGVYTNAGTKFVPSLFHFTQAMALMFYETHGFSIKSGNRKIPHPDLSKHLAKLSRDELVLMGPVGWGQWWDDLESITTSIGAPLAPVTYRRDIYEQVVAQALPLLAAQPVIPASNSGIEHRIRSMLKPVLRGRKQRYRNLTRTNALLDLVVCAATTPVTTRNPTPRQAAQHPCSGRTVLNPLALDSKHGQACQTRRQRPLSHIEVHPP
ncbi:MAG: hypothetical protein HQ453_02300, partial [Actinobacteria bacterium]|nr:hypothetical protein [Actinomycetota bacterium]